MNFLHWHTAPALTQSNHSQILESIMSAVLHLGVAYMEHTHTQPTLPSSLDLPWYRALPINNCSVFGLWVICDCCYSTCATQLMLCPGIVDSLRLHNIREHFSRLRRWWHLRVCLLISAPHIMLLSIWNSWNSGLHCIRFSWGLFHCRRHRYISTMRVDAIRSMKIAYSNRDTRPQITTKA